MGSEKTRINRVCPSRAFVRKAAWKMMCPEGNLLLCAVLGVIAVNGGFDPIVYDHLALYFLII
jgi:hypothetical protein